MYSPDQLCETIRSISPDVGRCGNKIKTCYDPKNKAWIVQLKQGNRRLSTYVDLEDAGVCISGKQCLGLGLQVFQLKDNLSFNSGNT